MKIGISILCASVVCLTLNVSAQESPAQKEVRRKLQTLQVVQDAIRATEKAISQRCPMPRTPPVSDACAKAMQDHRNSLASRDAICQDLQLAGRTDVCP